LFLFIVIYWWGSCYLNRNYSSFTERKYTKQKYQL
jgi:hypothetical protein